MVMSEQNPGIGTIVVLALVGLLIGVAVIGVLIIPGLQPGLVITSSVVSTSASTSAKGPIVQVSIVPNSGSDTTLAGYSPDVIIVVIGINSTVTWTDDDVSPHTVTVPNNALDSGNLNRGQSFTYRFTSPDTYEYKCTYHPWMHGTVIAKNA